MIANTQRRILNRWYFLGVLFLFLVFFPSIIGLDGMNGGFALSFVAGFMVISSIIAGIAIPAIWAPRYRYRKLQHSEAEVLIAENGLIIGRMFHLWESTGTSLDKISLNTNGNGNFIEFVYSAITRTGRQEETARVPVPTGKLDEAVRIIQHFNSSAH